MDLDRHVFSPLEARLFALWQASQKANTALSTTRGDMWCRVLASLKADSSLVLTIQLLCAGETLTLPLCSREISGELGWWLRENWLKGYISQLTLEHLD